MVKKSLSTAKVGMNKSTAPNLLSEQQYTHAKNANLREQTGEEINLTNEESNLLSTRFKTGYKVIGRKYFFNIKKTFFFLTNPETGFSEIGYLNDEYTLPDLEDTTVNCTNCNTTDTMPEPLENVTQEPTQEYVTIIRDDCVGVASTFGQGCLNFNMNYPIKSIVFKQEQSGNKLYFTDFLNGVRSLELDNLQKYTQIGSDVCDIDTIETVCLDCEKLEVFPDIKVPNTEVRSVTNGGELKPGMYETVLSYCSETGEELSRYYSLTNPVSIFDEQNRNTIDSLDRTNYGFEININNLDLRFANYKLVVIGTDAQSNRFTFVDGIYPITQNNVNITTERNKRTIDANFVLSLLRPKVEKAKTLSTANGYLFLNSPIIRKPMNLQPVANLLGAFLKWQTHVAKESLYKNGDFVSNYRGYYRDETYAKSIRFLLDGDYSPNYLLVGRPLKNSEKTAAGLPIPLDVTGKTYKSINNLDNLGNITSNNINGCADIDIVKKWQVFNTATVDDNCALSEDLEYSVIERVEEKSCEQENITETSSIDWTSYQVTIDISEQDDFISFAAYINDNISNWVSSYEADPLWINTPQAPDWIDTNFLDAFITSNYTDCIPLGFQETETLLDEVGNPVLDEFGDPILVAPDRLIIDEQGNNIGGCKPLTGTNTEEIIIEEVQGELQTFTEASFPEDYPKNRPPEKDFCNIFDDKNALIRVIDCTCNSVSCVRDSITNVPLRDNLLRSETPFEKSCSIATPLQIQQNTNTQSYQAYSVNYFFGYSADPTEPILETRYSQLLSSKIATPISSQWSNDVSFLGFIGKNAEWFSINSLNIDKFIIDFSRILQVKADLFQTEELRLSIYTSCSNNQPPVYTTLIDVDRGIRLKLEKGETDLTVINDIDPLTPSIISNASSNNYYVAVDSPLRVSPTINPSVCSSDLTEQASSLEVFDPVANEFVNPQVMATATNGCFNIIATPIKNVSVDITFNNLVLNKIDKYQTDCYYQVPIIDDCRVAPYETGDFAYTESQQNYPDNKQLFDSSTLQISPEDIPTEHRNSFEEYFVESTVDGSYNLKENTNLTCKPIRHFKYPDNTISPFCLNSPIIGESESVIFPIGCTIDENLINSFLDIALKNNLITEQDRKRIRGYEILRADRRGNESIIAKGLTYDMMEYKEQSSTIERTVNYSNFPFNDLGKNTLFYDKNKNFLQPKNNGDGNNMWTFHSPDTDYKINSQNPSFMNVEGYLKGNYSGQFNEVREHPGYVILGKRLDRLASTLATIEVAADIAIKGAEMTSRQWFFGGPLGVGSSLGLVGTAIVIAEGLVSSIVNYGRYRNQWNETFKDLGKPRNFAYYYTGIGNYSWLDNTIEEDERIRPLNIAKRIKRGRLQITDQQDGESHTINHLLREPSMLIKSPVEHPITYSNSYKNYDNTETNPNKSSRFFESQRGLSSKGLSPDVEGNVASMYTSLKNYLPSQYGDVDSLQTKWITTGYTGDLDNPKSDCLPIFGGDVYITRHTLLRRFPIFNSYAIDTADRTPFDYTPYSNLGDRARFFINYDTEGEDASAGRPLPIVESKYNLDNEVGRNDSYVKEPSKFYLFYNGIPNFLVESTINTWNRASRPQPKDNFYPNIEDVMEFTQERVNTIKNQESFLYSYVYSKTPSYFGGALLPSNYDKELYNRALDLKNGTMYSLKDSNENIKFDPWLIFRQNDNFVFPTDYGQLIDLTRHSRNAIFGRFDTTSVLFNAVDTISDDGGSPELDALGAAGIFARRPQTLSDSELGQFGSDVYEYVSSQFGNFYVDAKRGKVYRVSGNNPEEISAYSGDKPNGMKHWFRKNLPFRILNYFPDVDVDNPMNGVGITVGWDNQYNRFFLTKKDYTPKSNVQKDETGFYIEDKGIKTYVELTDPTYFEDVSFTIAYSPEYGAWISTYDFKPNYYVNKLDYFQTGINAEGSEKGLWSHLLTNKSYNVFYGKKYDFEIEYPVKSEFVSKVLNNVELWTEARRYKGEYDFDLNNKITFNESIIYNNYHNSGKLELIPQKNNLFTNGYPKTFPDKQQILITNKDNFKWGYDYFFNRVKDKSNQSMFITDTNNIDKQVNPQVVKFKGKTVLERLRGDWFLNRLTYNKDSRYSLTFKFAVNETDS